MPDHGEGHSEERGGRGGSNKEYTGLDIKEGEQEKDKQKDAQRIVMFNFSPRLQRGLRGRARERVIGTSIHSRDHQKRASGPPGRGRRAYSLYSLTIKKTLRKIEMCFKLTAHQERNDMTHPL